MATERPRVAEPDAIACADCLDWLAGMPAGAAQLIYLDPPFNTRRRRGFNDDLGSTADYIAYMRPRVQAMRTMLAGTGSLFFHCDWRASHSVKLLLDEIFDVAARGGGVFVNEIIWRYGLGASRGRRQLLTKHDVVFWYARTAAYTFNLLRGEPTPAMLRKYSHVDEAGRRFMMSYGKRYYLQGGKPLDDVWEVPAIAPTSRERTGYPTQKPVALLRRIVHLASNEGDLVIDPFCGSGTTLVAARQLGRRWMGCDSSPDAVKLARVRTAQTELVGG